MTNSKALNSLSPEKYLEVVNDYHTMRQTDNIIKKIVQGLKRKDSMPLRLLEVGSGYGKLSEELYNSSRLQITGIDKSRQCIDYVHKHYGYHRDCEFMCLDFVKDALPFTKQFDVIVMQQIMEEIHETDLEKLLRRTWTLLKKNGHLIIADEFIPNDYFAKGNPNKDRKVYLVVYYLKMIHEAIEMGCRDLAIEFVKKILSIMCPKQVCQDLYTEEVYKQFFGYGKAITDIFYRCSVDGFIQGCEDWFEILTLDLASICRRANSNLEINFDRVGSITSTQMMVTALHMNRFEVEDKRYRVGPVEQIGGPGVLTFKKK